MANNDKNCPRCGNLPEGRKQDMVVSTGKLPQSMSNSNEGVTAIPTTYSSQSHYGIPVLRIKYGSDTYNNDYGPADYVVVVLLAADVVAGWAKDENRIKEEIEAAWKQKLLPTVMMG